MSPDVNEFELEANIRRSAFRQGSYIAVCKGCSHVIRVHNLVGIIATSSSSVSGLGAKPRKICGVYQVRTSIWLIAADSIGIARKDNILEIKKEKLN